MSSISCPLCGTKSLIFKEKTRILKEPFGGQQEVQLNKCYCKTCEYAGDFSDQNVMIIEKTLELLKIQSTKNILDYFSSKNIKMSVIERILSLPQRTLSKWKNGVTKPSSAGITLMKFLRTFPWLLDVAENNFDNHNAQLIHINSALHEIINLVNPDYKYSTRSEILIFIEQPFIFNHTPNQLSQTCLPDNKPILNMSDKNQVFKIETNQLQKQ